MAWLNSKEAAKKLNCSRRTIQRRAKAGLLEFKDEDFPTLYWVETKEDQSSLKENIKEEKLKEYDQDSLLKLIKNNGSVSSFLKKIEKLSQGDVRNKQNILETKDLNYILSLSDLHFPFADEDAIYKILDKHSEMKDLTLVLNGDILDMYAASSFSKDKSIRILDEYNLALDFLINIKEDYPNIKKIHLVQGNHEARLDTYFSKKIDPDMLALTNKNLLSDLADGIVYNSEGEKIGNLDFSNVHFDNTGLPWLLQIGKTVFAHPSSYKSGVMATVSSVQNFLDHQIGADKYDSIIIGHTHQVGSIVHKGKLLIEQGCLCSAMGYLTKGRVAAKNQSLGYALIAQDKDGNTDFNNTKVEFLGIISII